MNLDELVVLVCEVAGVPVDRADETLAQAGFPALQDRNLFRTRLRLRLADSGLTLTNIQIPNDEGITLREIARQLAILSLAGISAPPPALHVAGIARVGFAVDERNYATVRIFYATDRALTGKQAPTDFFGGERSASEQLHLGSCEVSIPRDHRMAALESPSIWRLEFRPDPGKHVVLLSISPLEGNDFFNQAKQRVAASARGEAFVFIHGYNVAFADAARRTAQLAYDLAFDGAPILYSWPSHGDFVAYAADENNVEWSAPHLAAFLTDLRKQTGAATIHLIAHSMGNRCLARALASLAGTTPPFQQVILTAPDIDSGVFRQLAAALRSTAGRVTLYASSHDRALAASRKLHAGSRAGESGPDLVVCDGIDTIDASAVETDLLGHSYFANARSVVGDLFQLLRTGEGPADRVGLHPVDDNGKRHWSFVP